MLLSIAIYFQALPNIVRYQPILSSGAPCIYSVALHSFSSANSRQLKYQIQLVNIAIHCAPWAIFVNIVNFFLLFQVGFGCNKSIVGLLSGQLKFSYQSLIYVVLLLVILCFIPISQQILFKSSNEGWGVKNLHIVSKFLAILTTSPIN